MVANLYGESTGPTYPDSLHRTNELLTPLAQELIIGRSGPRVVCGDFNQSPEALE